jgi:hypothetical protein
MHNPFKLPIVSLMFLLDRYSFFREHQRSPNEIRVVSLEVDIDRMADEFWSCPSLHFTSVFSDGACVSNSNSSPTPTARFA